MVRKLGYLTKELGFGKNTQSALLRALDNSLRLFPLEEQVIVRLMGMWVRIWMDTQKCLAGTCLCSVVQILVGRDSSVVAASCTWPGAALTRESIYLHLLNWMEHSDGLELQEQPSVQGHEGCQVSICPSSHTWQI